MSKKFILEDDFPSLYQYPVLPTGCEATSLTMLLNWLGFSSKFLFFYSKKKKILKNFEFFFILFEYYFSSAFNK